MGAVLYLLLLAAALIFFAGCGTLNQEADERLERTIAWQKHQERRAA